MAENNITCFCLLLFIILFANIITGVLIDILYSIYFIVKDTYLSDFTTDKKEVKGTTSYKLNLVLNVIFNQKNYPTNWKYSGLFHGEN